ncbi:chorismate--pyruvate lyase family protein [Planctobacterium marinum]|uniref:Probable chorismate pyruvate-lyase n=1 Tax=Planctobacterium marinum TaxID=1631968 RepID=A0AA48KQM5_9ALTE|nr:putative chorismate pyruvate-lyase [Planctobacterium marinum]
MTESLLNIGPIKEPWLSPECLCPQDPLLRNWLLNTGSLTERLQSQCLRFDVEVLSQSVSGISQDETNYLYGQFDVPAQSTQVREVFLKGNDQHWVFARSLLPCEFLHQEMAELTQLGNQPLGKIIFNDDRFERLGFQLVECPVAGATQTSLAIRAGFSLWGRRSLFRFKQHHIMVAEIFLPDCPAYSYNP